MMLLLVLSPQLLGRTLGLISIHWVGAAWSAHIRVLVVQVLRVLDILLHVWIWVGVVGLLSAGHSLMSGWRLPAAAGHVRAAIDTTVLASAVVGWWLKCGWKGVRSGVGSQGRSARASINGHVRLRGWGSRSWAVVLQLAAHMRWHRHAVHNVVVGWLALHMWNAVQRRRDRYRTVVGGWSWQRRLGIRVLFAVGTGTPGLHGSTRRQSGGGGGSGLLDGTSVVVLVASEGSTAGEGLLAVGIRALVWPLSGMYSPMTRQGAGVAEWLNGR